MIKDELTDLIDKNDIEPAIIVRYGDKHLFDYQTDKVFPAGGLISLGIAAYIENEWKKDPDLLDEKLEVTDLSRVRGSGIISRLQQNIWPIRDLIYLSMAMADNAATNLLIERFDIYEIDDWLRDNYPGMRLGRELMRYSSTGQDNEVTATSVEKVLDHFISAKNEFADIIRAGLENETTHYNLATYDENSFPTYNKVASVDNNLHEVCGFQTQDAPLIIIALTSYPDIKSSDQLFLQNIGKVIFSKISLPKKKKDSRFESKKNEK